MNPNPDDPHDPLWFSHPEELQREPDPPRRIWPLAIIGLSLAAVVLALIHGALA